MLYPGNDPWQWSRLKARTEISGGSRRGGGGMGHKSAFQMQSFSVTKLERTGYDHLIPPSPPPPPRRDLHDKLCVSTVPRTRPQSSKSPPGPGASTHSPVQCQSLAKERFVTMHTPAHPADDHGTAHGLCCSCMHMRIMQHARTQHNISAMIPVYGRIFQILYEFGVNASPPDLE